jgi:hypothetical protein
MAKGVPDVLPDPVLPGLPLQYPARLCLQEVEAATDLDWPCLPSGKGR